MYGIKKRRDNEDIMGSYMKFTKKKDMRNRVVRKRVCLELQRGQEGERNNKQK